jgi:hypothetical protein
MMVRVAPDTPRLIDPVTQRVVCYVAPSCRVVASTNRAREWSATRCHIVAYHCSLRSAHFIGHDNAVCPHLATISVTRKCTSITCEPYCTPVVA